MRLRVHRAAVGSGGLVLTTALLLSLRPGGPGSAVVAAAPAPSPTATFSQSPVPGPTGSCGLIWSDPGGNTAVALVDTDVNLLKGTMSDAQKVLSIAVQVSNLAATMPTGVSQEDWDTEFWLNGTPYQALVERSDVSGLTYSMSTAGKNRVAVSGSLTLGPDGVVDIDIPFSLLGNPAKGADLVIPITDSFVSVEGEVDDQDRGGPQYDYRIGEGCR